MKRGNASSPEGALPLLHWPKSRQIAAIASERARLLDRIRRLRPHSHRRIELQTRLADLTRKQLELEAGLTIRTMP